MEVLIFGGFLNEMIFHRGSALLCVGSGKFANTEGVPPQLSFTKRE